MAIAGFQEFMLPILRYLNDDNEYRVKEIISYVESHFELTDDEKQSLVPSGMQTIVYNRTAWALSYMKSAMLVKNVKRGCYIITKRGKELLSTDISRISIKFLSEKYPEYNESRRGNKNKDDIEVHSVHPEEMQISPEELIEINFENIKSKLCDELLELILQNSPSYFEKLVIDLLVSMGYGGTRREAGKAVGKSGDEGIDGVISEDRLALDNIYIQAKRWALNRNIGRPEIQAFVGALAGKQANKGIFITTSSFSSEAKAYVKTIQQKVILIDGIELTQFMIDYNVGVSTYNTYTIKKIDFDYFDEV